ncbi:Gibberellin 3-beta-dioxygenase 2-3 [Rhynchospora pubera]|uniref:Gibberellin 3-beta-dioxygenase 2-3 n=1 Tax=Rhynchospora pubera TaxID=906938 RepID=A0AAV8DA60_9POAL|nr:Gibberellin 3-beta-dioxygenase 2-3 [Rhynchospora pubera]
MSLHETRKIRIHQPENFQFDSIPDSHAWVDLHDHPTVEPVGPDTIPVIDLNDPKLVEKIGKACEEWGVFLISNHGIEPKLLNQFCSQMHRLFALPADVKLKVAKADALDAGYGGDPISRFFPKYTWSEAFTILDSPLEHAKKLWPDDYSSFCEVMEEYKKAMNPLGRRLMHAMLLSLGVSEEEIINVTPMGDFGKIKTVLSLNSYPACPDADRVLGLPPHSDNGFITFVYDNGVSGLQILRRKDDNGPKRWVTVPVVPDTFVVNVGDLMQVLTNGRFHNMVHRATIGKTYHRMSSAYFFASELDVKVSPLSKLTDPGVGPLYKTVTWPELLQMKNSLSYDEALEAIKIDSNLRGE